MLDKVDGVLGYIKKIKTLADQLDAVGALVSKKDLMIMLIGSLRESYQLLSMALNPRMD
uniref:Uncharacterized protein n=1 Tax=Peronospora matthiolae TaxID=2874970 RepID=A0AAV1TM52_9STRA